MQSNSFVGNLFRGIQKRISSTVSAKSKKADLTWLREKYLKHASSGTTRAYLYKGKKIFYNSPTEFLHTLKEIFVEEIYQVSLPPNAYIIDCGSNIGLSVIYLKEKFPDSEIVAFEPDNNNYALLLKNIESLDLQNVSVRKEAVWIKEEELSFSNEGTMGSKIDTGAISATQKVKAIRLKTFLERKVHFLKIDIEGAEYKVIKDIAENLANVDYLFLEYHGQFEQNNELTDIFTILQQSGLHYYIKEAAQIYSSPLLAPTTKKSSIYDIQLNIFCFRK